MRVEVREAATILELPDQTVRVMLQHGSPLGRCEKISTVNKYLIFSHQLASYIGMTVEEVEKKILEMRGAES